MPTDEAGKVIPITEASLARMPKRMARRLRVGLRPEVCPEFDEWVEDMGYRAMASSPMVRQLMYEAFVGGWGAKIRQLKQKRRTQDGC